MSVTEAPVSVADFRAAMRLIVGNVSVITAGAGDDRSGLVVISVVSLSAEPPKVIACVNRSSSTWPVIERYRHFCVNLLSREQQRVAERFSGVDGTKGAARYDGAEWIRLASGASALAGALAAIDCEVEEIIERHSHAIILGRVVAITAGTGEPIVYHNGRYGGVQF